MPFLDDQIQSMCFGHWCRGSGGSLLAPSMWSTESGDGDSASPSLSEVGVSDGDVGLLLLVTSTGKSCL